MPSVVADALPTAHDVKARCQRRQELGNLLWVVLQIGVHGENDFSAGGTETRGQGRSLAEIAPQPETQDTRVTAGQFTDYIPRPVCAAVIDHEDFDLQARVVSCLDDLVD